MIPGFSFSIVEKISGRDDVDRGEENSGAET